MLSSKLDIWNMAIGHLGQSIEIGSETENTAAARACRRFYDSCREDVLRKAPWPFAKRYVLLAQVISTVPATEFKYAYRYPANALMVRRILNGTFRVEDMQSRIPYRIMSDDQGRMIMCDVAPLTVPTDATKSSPWIEYTVNAVDETKFSSDFAKALSYCLAVDIGPRIAGDKSKLRDAAGALYVKALAQAQINALNEEAQDDSAPSEFERSREGWVVGQDDRRLFEGL